MHKTKDRHIRKGGSLSWAERDQMLKEYLQGGQTKNEIWYKYTGQQVEHGQMLRWMRKLGYTTGDQQTTKTDNTRQQAEDRQQALASKKQLQLGELQDALSQSEEQIKALERKLEDTQLRAEGYELMIQMAEKSFKIPIKKKFDTK